MRNCEQIETVIIGGGQAGLSVGHHLQRLGRPFVILEANARVGDSWRSRWDSLRLFTPARYDGLDGMPFPAPAYSFPTKDEMADYLEAYAWRFRLPVRTDTRVERVGRSGSGFSVRTETTELEAANVVVAMSNYQQPRVPAFARELKPSIVQLHSSEYRSPAQLQPGGVLIAGAGNSGSEIAMELVRTHPVWMSGRDTGHVPFRIHGPAARFILPLLFRVFFHRVLSLGTPMGRRFAPRATTQGGPLIRVHPVDLAAAGVQRVPRTSRAERGLPVLEDGTVLDVANVVWCTGFEPGFHWLDLPGCNGGVPAHRRGVSSVPGLYFVGLHFLYAMSSVMIHGVGRDACHVARAIARDATRLPRAHVVDARAAAAVRAIS